MFAAFVLLIVIVAAIAIWVALAMLPGRIAKSRNHPQAEAINVLGWLGLLFGGVGWVGALVWAYTKPVFTPVAQGVAASEGAQSEGAQSEGAQSGEPGEAEEAR